MLAALSRSSAPYAHHVTDSSNIPSILRYGIGMTDQGYEPESVPSAGIGQPSRTSAYLNVMGPYNAPEDFDSENAIRIDLRKLDAAMLVADEDHCLDSHPELYDDEHDS